MRGAKIGKLRRIPVMRVERQKLCRGTETKTYLAREADGEERAQWWDRAVTAYPSYAEMQTRTDRVLPVFVLDPI